ncbi:MAG: type II toxin-antitoxin system VapC family toxin [bacterium]|nr:type II toxin-antitoxin system VapC family toxin [bacterium]MDT8396306.1 type II toxin-antitoxin system VapC family toxin [bacterium]
MNHLVIDASVAIKWLVEEEGTAEALTVLDKARLSAPDLLIAECANILWKKVQREELSEDEALIGARILEQADLEILPTRHLLSSATSLAVLLDHPAYDCVYLELALERGWRFATADERFLRKIRGEQPVRFSDMVLSLREAVAVLD